VKREVATEIAYSTLNLELSSWLNGVADQGIRFAVISDFYLDAAALTEILASTGFTLPIPFFVSCEKGVSKLGQGELLKLVRREMEVDAKRHLHIGDNAYSDFEMQVSTGGAALLVPTPADVEEARDHHGLDPGDSATNRPSPRSKTSSATATFAPIWAAALLSPGPGCRRCPPCWF
jgi:hypothetical protein